MRRRPAAQACECEGEQIAALGRRQRVDFVDDHRLQVFEEDARVFGSDKQTELLRRGEKHVRRVRALTLALVRGRVAGAGFEANGKVHLAHRRFEIARDVCGERLERRNVKRVQLVRAARPLLGQRREFDQTR